MTYHTLVQFDPEADAWGIEFGDYDRETVEDELEDYVDHSISRKLLKIVTTDSEANAEIEAAVAALPKLKAFTFEASDYIPRGLHVTVYAANAADALAEAERIIAEGEIDWGQQNLWDEACTSTRISGLWAGTESHAGDDLRTPQQRRDYDVEVTKEVAPLALEPDPRAFTVFCQDETGSGTIWIDTVEASNADAAALLGQQKCAQDWGRYAEDENGEEDPETLDCESIHVLGVAAGDVKILHWEDIPE